MTYATAFTPPTSAASSSRIRSGSGVAGIYIAIAAIILSTARIRWAYLTGNNSGKGLRWLYQAERGW